MQFKSKINMKKLFSILFVAVSMTMIAQESALLRLNYEKGDKFLTQMNMKQDMGIAKTDMMMDMVTNVKDIVNNIYKLEMSFDKAVMDVSQMGISIQYDSSMKEEEMNPKAKAMHNRMKPMFEMIIGMDATKLGKLSNVKFIKGQGDIEQVMQNSNSIIFPEEAVKVGSTWKQDASTNGMKLVYNYTVTKITTDTVSLKIDGSVSELATGTITGNSEIDRKTGVPTNTTMTMDLDMMGQKMKTDMNVTMKKI